MSLLVAVLLRGVAVALAGLLAMRLLRRASAATRAAAGAMALGAMLALPLGLLYAPKAAVSVGRIPFEETALARLSTAGAPVATRVEPVVVPAPGGRTVPLGTVILGLWALVALVLGVRVVRGWFVALGWARPAHVLANAESHPDAGTYGDGLNVLVSPEVPVACAFWAGRPVVLLPEGQTGWSAGRRSAVLAHEAAHVRRGDWAVLVLSRLALALHWPNPFAWLLAREVHRAAEDAADDAVLRAGHPPADYAEHLLDLARCPWHAAFALTLTLGHRPDVHRRIVQVLNPQRTRGTATLATLALASLLVGGVFVPATCLVVRRTIATSQIFGAQAAYPTEAQSWAPDVRDGGTEAGTPENGFHAKMKDGRTVELVQVVLNDPKKGRTAWKPDGTPVPASQIAKVPTIGAHYRTLLMRYPSEVRDAEGGLGSGRGMPGEPSTMSFGGGGDRPGRKPGERECFSFIGVPEEGGKVGTFTFSLVDTPWETETTLPGAPGERGDAGHLKAVMVAYPETATPFRRDAKGGTVQDAKGEYLHDKVSSTGVRFTIPEGEALRSVRLAARLKDGRTVEPFWNDGGYQGQDMHHHWYFRQTLSEIAQISIETRESHHAEFNGVRLVPNPKKG